jgi:hypothetical protein
MRQAKILPNHAHYATLLGAINLSITLNGVVPPNDIVVLMVIINHANINGCSCIGF